MSIPYTKKHNRYKAAIARLEAMPEMLKAARAYAEETRADFVNASICLGIEPDDEKAVAIAIRRDGFRRQNDDCIRSMMQPANKHWTFVAASEYFKDEYCDETLCFFKANPDKHREFKQSFFECGYAGSSPVKRMCERCFHQIAARAGFFISFNGARQSIRSIEDILLLESRRMEEFAPEARVERAVLSDEWRALSPPMHCVVCDNGLTPAVRCVATDPKNAVCESTDAAHTPNAEAWTATVHFQQCIACANGTKATRILVGHSETRLCDAHYARRAELRELLLEQARSRVRVDSA